MPKTKGGMMNKTDQEKLDILIKTAFVKAKLAEQEWMNLCLNAHLLYGYTPEKIKELCKGK